MLFTNMKGRSKTFSMIFHFVILDLFEAILPRKSFLSLVHLLNIDAIFSWLTPEYPFISICASQFFINSYCLLKDLFFKEKGKSFCFFFFLYFMFVYFFQ